MISSLRARLLVAIGALAVTAVAAVAIAARQTTRLEFQRFAELERTSGPDERTIVDDIAQALDGRCCDDAAVARASAGLARGVAMLVIDDANRVRAVRGFG